MQVTLQEPLIFEGLERARFWSSHGTLQREIAPHNPCAVFSLFSLVCLQVMSASRISRSRTNNMLKPTWWRKNLACQGFSRTCSEIDGGLA